LAEKLGIARIEVDGLHEQFDVDLSFKAGLNIIYGKNGRGKTTVIHILVNALELDFKRFEHLSFRRIAITTFRGSRLEIVKIMGDGLKIYIDGDATSLSGESGTLSEAETASLRAAMGPRPTYLPAFRSVLERVRNEYNSPYRDPAREAETALLSNSEFQALRETVNSRNRDLSETRALREEANVNARKTMQCRQWFGAFVPIVRYPSIVDVEDGLTNEWRSTQIKMAQREQNMFAEVFAKVFRTIVGLDDIKITSESEEELLASIATFLNSNDDKLGAHGPNAIYGQLMEATDFLKKNRARDSNGIERSVLQLYLQTLDARNSERSSAFQKTKDFENSVNSFLDEKILTIGDNPSTGRLRSAVTVGKPGGRSYGLSALSSGEKQILTMLYSASRSHFKTGIFLIDEPELSLHIDWQRQILREMMAQAPDSQIIACTHSPEVAADHFEDTQDFEPTPSVRESEGLFDDLDHSEE
jgi:predicted ATPase